MADKDLSAALPAAAHPMANPGYGKRSAPHERPRTATDFAHLPVREASIAGLIDRLPEGAAIDGKTLAAVQPHYGQAACLTALRRLSEAGHLRRFREHVVHPDGSRWVSLTYFSRTARDDAWWAAFQAGGPAAEVEASRAPTPVPAAAVPPVPSPTAPPEPEPPGPSAKPSPTRRSRAFGLLAALGRRDPRLFLSVADCTALEPLAVQWLARDDSETRFVQALTAGLPPVVHSPRGLLRTRLRDKLPPETETAERDRTPPPLRLTECTICRAPGRPEALPGGVCAICRSGGRGRGPVSGRTGCALSAADVHGRAAAIRRTIRAGTEPVPGTLR